MFRTRLISGIVLLAAAVALLFVGGTPLLLALGIISLIGQQELYRAIGIDHKAISFIGYFTTVVYYLLVCGWKLRCQAVITVNAYMYSLRCIYLYVVVVCQVTYSLDVVSMVVSNKYGI